MWVPGLPRAYPGWDLTRVFWADLAFARTAVASGELPLWNPYDRAGYPFLAEPQSGMFDPLTWLLVGLALGIGHAPAWLIVLKAVIAFAIGGAGVAVYLHGRGLPTWVQTWAVVVFVMCPRMDKLKDQSALWPTVWIGWVLWAVDRCLRRPTLARGAALGATCGLLMNAGYPPGAFRLALLVVPYTLCVLVQERRQHGALRGYVRTLAGPLAVALAIAVALVLGQWVATLGVLESTRRAALDPGQVAFSRTMPVHALGVLAPTTDRLALNLYVGAVAVAGIVLALVRVRALPLAFFAIAALGFVLACGEDLPILPALASLPGFRSFRIAGHYTVLTVLGLLFAAAFGLGELERIKGREARTIPVAIAVLVMVMGQLGFASQRSGWSHVWVAGTVLVVLVAAFASPGWRRFGMALVPVVAGVDLFVAARPVAEILQPLPREQRARVLATAVGDAEVFRVADFGWSGNRPGPRERIRDLEGHLPALTDPHYLEVHRVAPNAGGLLRAMNVSVLASPRLLGASIGADVVIGQKGLYRIADPWPLAFWTEDVRVVEDGNAVLLSLIDLDARPHAAFERKDLPAEVASRWPAWTGKPRGEGAVYRESKAPRLLEQRHNRLVFEIEVPRAGMFVVVESFAPGWIAEVDGEARTIWRVNAICRAVELAPGRHRVVMRYAPPGVVPSFVLWLATMIGLVAWAVHARLRARRG